MSTPDKVGEDDEDTYYITRDITWTQHGDF